MAVDKTGAQDAPQLLDLFSRLPGGQDRLHSAILIGDQHGMLPGHFMPGK